MVKVSKQSADYRRPSAKSKKTCRNCRSMNTDGSCDKVRGMVSPSFLCDLWSKK